LWKDFTTDYTDYTDDLIADFGVANAEFFPSVESVKSAVKRRRRDIFVEAPGNKTPEPRRRGNGAYLRHKTLIDNTLQGCSEYTAPMGL
jgi:hypothetical protein